MIDVTCARCGKTMQMPVEVAGRSGRCPQCGGSIQVPGRPSQGFGGSAVQEDNWVDIAKDQAAGIGGPVNSELRAANRQVYVPPIVFYGIWASLAGLANQWKAYVFSVLGAQGAWDGWKMLAYALLVWVVSATTISGASVTYTRFTGRVYTEDRTGFAKAGGFDVGRIMQVVVVVGLFGIFMAFERLALLAPYGNWRRPWVFAVLLLLLSFPLSSIAARIVFRARFGQPKAR